MSSFNKVILMGHLVRDPELRATGGGTNVGSFSLAINNRGKDGKESVSYIDCVAFGKQADFAKEYLTNAMPILIDGRLSRADGSRRGRNARTST
ncbi:MAG: Single-stranded DNA-binding protein [Leptospirillum sp. Group IV 'UBA BS']|nr:MAG: Single-stranded DNA-binding protein [Leptospirillum sp. Group IV 'UBA BS']